MLSVQYKELKYIHAHAFYQSDCSYLCVFGGGNLVHLSGTAPCEEVWSEVAGHSCSLNLCCRRETLAGHILLDHFHYFAGEKVVVGVDGCFRCANSSAKHSRQHSLDNTALYCRPQDYFNTPPRNEAISSTTEQTTHSSVCTLHQL